MIVDWHIDVGTILATITIMATGIGGVWQALKRVCGKFDVLGDNQDAISQQLTETTRRLDEYGADLRQLRDWLMHTRSDGR